MEVRNLSRSFGGLMAVYNLEFTVNEGEILGLIGPNGSGKTTVFNLITGFLRPDSGSIRLRKEEIIGLKPQQVCGKGIARTFQLVKPFPHMTALQNVMVGRVYGRSPARSLKEAASQASDVLEFVGLAGKGCLLARNLTLVERKRLELARALATSPKLLLLDELMAGLNPAEAQGAMALIRKIRDSGITIIMIEHIIKAVFGISNRVVVVSAGEKIAEGLPEQIVEDEKVIEAYLGRLHHA